MSLNEEWGGLVAVIERAGLGPIQTSEGKEGISGIVERNGATFGIRKKTDRGFSYIYIDVGAQETSEDNYVPYPDNFP